MTSGWKAELIQTCNCVSTGEEPDDTAALAFVVREILRALPVTDEREGRHKVGNPVCPKCFASHPPLLDCTLQFVANAAPVEGDEAWHDAANEFLDQALNGKDPVAAVKAIVAKAPKN
jgi:hypothetical protein